jgi:hypothetical protein
VQFITPATVLAFAPIAEFFIRMVLAASLHNRMEGVVVREMQRDSRTEVQRIGKNEPIRDALNAYAAFASRTETILESDIMALFSLVLSQYECTGSLFPPTLPHFVLLLLILLYIPFVLYQLLGRRIEPAAVNAGRWYHVGGLLLCVFVIALTCAGKAFPSLCVQTP